MTVEFHKLNQIGAFIALIMLDVVPLLVQINKHSALC